MRRRDCITLLGGAAAAWPIAARAQQPATPVVGYLSAGAPEPSRVAAFVKGLSEMGYAEGHNVAIEYRWADNEPARLSELAADLVRRRVSVIAAMQTITARAAKAETFNIPVVFISAGDAVQAGLVSSFNRPGANLTGINILFTDLGPKQLGLLHDLLPQATRFGMLVEGAGLFVGENVKVVQAAADKIGGKIEILPAASARDIDTIFAALPDKQVQGVLVATGQLFVNRRVQLAAAATRHAVPTIFNQRDFAEAGGLMSYGPSIADAYRQVGIYGGRILKGEKPRDMPVMQPTKFEFVINMQTARTIGIEVPANLLVIADEVIE
jgi:putative tryptophan/tyrosine transport system substrate-binding protein